MKKILIVFVAICLVFAINSIIKGKDSNREDLQVVGELLESIETNEYDTMVCTKKDADLFSEQKIYINFGEDEKVEEVLIEEKYSNRDVASSAYDKILADENNEEVILDGMTLTYNATKTFGYDGMTKIQMTEVMNEYKNDGINTGYVITWE